MAVELKSNENAHLESTERDKIAFHARHETVAACLTYEQTQMAPDHFFVPCQRKRWNLWFSFLSFGALQITIFFIVCGRQSATKNSSSVLSFTQEHHPKHVLLKVPRSLARLFLGCRDEVTFGPARTRSFQNYNNGWLSTHA